MSDKSKSDWSFIENMRKQAEDETNPKAKRGELLTPISEDLPAVPDVAVADEPQSPDGILASFQAKNVSRRAAIKALRVNYDHQIEALKHNLSKALQVSKAKADTMAKEFLMELDSRHLNVLGQLGLRNKETRERVLEELSDSTAATIRKLQSKDWPSSFIQDAIDQSLKLRERAIDEIMKDIGETD